MCTIQVIPFQSGQENVVAHLHNTAFAEWQETLDSCYRYTPLTPETVLTWTQPTTGSVWMAYVNGNAVGYASCEIQMESGHREVFRHGKGIR